MEQKERLLLNADGTWTQELTLSRNIGRQDQHLYDLLNEGEAAGPPTYVGKRGHKRVYVGNTMTKSYGIVVTKHVDLATCWLQKNRDGTVTLQPWNTYPDAQRNPVLKFVAPLKVQAPANSVFMFVRMFNAVNLVAETLEGWVVSAGKIGVLPLPNVWNTAAICEGDTGTAGSYETIPEAMLNSVAEFERRVSNNHLVDGADLARNRFEEDADGLLHMHTFLAAATNGDRHILAARMKALAGTLA